MLSSNQHAEYPSNDPISKKRRFCFPAKCASVFFSWKIRDEKQSYVMLFCPS